MTPEEMKETKQINDYVPLYIGCEIETVDGLGINLGFYYPSVWTEEGRAEPNGINVLFNYEVALKNKVYVMNFIQCKLILRPLSSITEEEENQAYTIRGTNSFNEFEGETVKYLLSKHFDLFGLIDSGLAIDKTNQ